MGYIKNVLNNCNNASLLTLKDKETKLTLKQKFEMQLHIYFCKCCQNFKKQSAIIDATFKAYFNAVKENPPVKASDEFKEKMKEQLK